MRKITVLLIWLGIASTGCSTVDQNMKARKNLAKCRFELERLALDRVNFNALEPKSADFDIYLKIINPNEDDVVVDRADINVFLDNSKTGIINHKNFARIKGKTSSVEKLDLNIPLSGILKLAGKKPENIIADGVVYLNILMGSFTLETSMAFPVKKSFPVPYDKIKEAIDRKLAELEKKTVTGDLKEKAADLKKGIKKKIK